MKKSLLFSLLAGLFGSVVGIEQAYAIPASLEGLGLVSQWTDYENASGEMPANPWGNSNILLADKVGIYVQYANGLTGSATYSGVANAWGGCCDLNGIGQLAPTTATGFFVGTGNYANLHGLDNNGFILPMAWTDLTNQFTDNFDLSFENFGNSTWRASQSGWEFVDIALYSSAVAVNNVPEPTSLALLGLGIASLASLRRRKGQ